MYRIPYLLIGFIYLFFVSWAGITVSIETIPVLVVILALGFAGFSPSDYPNTKNGLWVVLVTMTLGVIGCIFDAIRLYKDPAYTFDGLSVLFVIVTIILFLVHIFNSIDRFKKSLEKSRASV